MKKILYSLAAVTALTTTAVQADEITLRSDQATRLASSMPV